MHFMSESISELIIVESKIHALSQLGTDITCLRFFSNTSHVAFITEIYVYTNIKHSVHMLRPPWFIII